MEKKPRTHEIAATVIHVGELTVSHLEEQVTTHKLQGKVWELHHGREKVQIDMRTLSTSRLVVDGGAIVTAEFAALNNVIIAYFTLYRRSITGQLREPSSGAHTDAHGA